jgi:hypothetical protein
MKESVKRKKQRRKIKYNKTKKTGGSPDVDEPSFFVERLNHIKYRKHHDHRDHF